MGTASAGPRGSSTTAQRTRAVSLLQMRPSQAAGPVGTSRATRRSCARACRPSDRARVLVDAAALDLGVGGVAVVAVVALADDVVGIDHAPDLDRQAVGEVRDAGVE